MIVTRISNPSRTGARAVYAKAEGERTQKVATLSDQALADLGIEPGVVWTDALAAESLRASGLFLARRDAFRMVGQRAVSRKRLVDRLRRKGHDAAVCNSIADELAAKGLVDDAAFAASLATSASRRAGKRLVEAKLRSRGIDRETAAKASAAAAKDRDAFEDAMTLGLARFKRMSDRLTPEAKRRRLYGLLARRGYDSDVCRKVVDRLMKPSGEE